MERRAMVLTLRKHHFFLLVFFSTHSKKGQMLWQHVLYYLPFNVIYAIINSLINLIPSEYNIY